MRRDERGVTLILFTLMITVMLVFVALAMDSGLVFNERRQDQSAADAAVLDAAQMLLEGKTRAEAMEAIIRGTLTNTESTNKVPLEGPGGWRERWKTCTSAPPGFVADVTYSCIAFRDIAPDNPTTKVWAHLPEITVGSTFGGVVGINSYKTTAEATAEIFIGTPYAVFAGATDCDHKNDVEQVVDIGTNDLQRIDITGPVHSNETLQLWTNATATDFVTFVKPEPRVGPQITAQPSGVEEDPLRDIRINDYVFQPGVNNKASVARAADLYVDAQGQPVDNGWLASNGYLDSATGALLKDNLLIYTTGPIHLTGPVTGRATFVSTDRINFDGNGYQLKPRNGDVLAFSSAGAHLCGNPSDDPIGEGIRFDGGNNTFDGIIYAPNGSIRSNDGQNLRETYSGGLVGWIVDLDGSNLFIGNDTKLGGPPKVRLFR